ncbi:MAG: hypothetical protein AAF542_17655 [Pseudomonadota bacterium]
MSEQRCRPQCVSMMAMIEGLAVFVQIDTKANGLLRVLIATVIDSTMSLMHSRINSAVALK